MFGKFSYEVLNLNVYLKRKFWAKNRKGFWAINKQ